MLFYFLFYCGSSMGECFALCGDEVLLSSHFSTHRLDFLYSSDVHIGQWGPRKAHDRSQPTQGSPTAPSILLRAPSS